MEAKREVTAEHNHSPTDYCPGCATMLSLYREEVRLLRGMAIRIAMWPVDHPNEEPQAAIAFAKDALVKSKERLP